jgi:hypothetical protein
VLNCIFEFGRSSASHRVSAETGSFRRNTEQTSVQGPISILIMVDHQCVMAGLDTWKLQYYAAPLCRSGLLKGTFLEKLSARAQRRIDLPFPAGHSSYGDCHWRG